MPEALLTSQSLAVPTAGLSSARELLLAWHNHRLDLAFVYSRSKGGLIVTGRAIIAEFEEAFLRLQTSDSNLLVTTYCATYSTEPQRFFTPDLQSSFLVDGVSVQLQNFDWLFLSSSAPPGNLFVAQPEIESRA